jgi:hypothetical protein
LNGSSVIGLVDPDASGGREIVWHNGGTGGYRTWAGYDSRARVGAVVLSNMSWSVDDIGAHLIVPTVPLTPAK